jgi:hypothetical protein
MDWITLPLKHSSTIIFESQGAERFGQASPRFFPCKIKGIVPAILPLGGSREIVVGTASGVAGLRVSMTDLFCSLAQSIPFRFSSIVGRKKLGLKNFLHAGFRRTTPLSGRADRHNSGFLIKQKRN